MAVMSFTIELYQTGLDKANDLEHRAKDLSYVFSSIVRQWARNNADKFDAGLSGAGAGTEVDPGVFWEPLSKRYHLSTKKQQSEGPDALMILTGALENALTNVGLFEKEIGPETATFGEPSSEFEAEKVAYNWARRQTIFLSSDDQRFIEGEVKRYFDFGGDYQNILFAKGLEAIAEKRNIVKGEIEFPDQAA